MELEHVSRSSQSTYIMVPAYWAQIRGWITADDDSGEYRGSYSLYYNCTHHHSTREGADKCLATGEVKLEKAVRWAMKNVEPGELRVEMVTFLMECAGYVR